MSSLDIDDGIQARGHIPGRFRELDDYWNESQALVKPGMNPGESWAAEFNQHGMDHGGPDSWVNSFEQQHGVNGWATEFAQVVASTNNYLIVRTKYMMDKVSMGITQIIRDLSMIEYRFRFIVCMM